MVFINQTYNLLAKLEVPFTCLHSFLHAPYLYFLISPLHVKFAEFYRLKAALTCKLDDRPAKILKRLPSVYFMLKGMHLFGNF